MIAEFLYRNPRILALSICVIVAAGISSWFVLPQLEDPVLGRRVGIISTIYPGATAEQVESLVTIPLEESLEGLVDIQRVRSNSQTGISNIAVELRDEVVSVDPIWAQVQDILANVQTQLPQTTKPPELTVVPLKAYAAIISVVPATDAGNTDLTVLRTQIRRLRSRILRIEGTEAVEIFGDPGEEIVVAVPPEQLVSHNLSIPGLAEQIQREQTTTPAAQLPGEQTSVAMSVGIAEDPIETIRNTQIRTGPNQTISLEDIALIERRSVVPPADAAIIDGRDATVVAVLVDDRHRVSAWQNQLNATLAEFSGEAEGLETELLFSQADHIRARITALLKNLAIGVVAVTMVVLFFMGWRCMLVVSISLPLASLMVIGAMRVLQIPIHQMSVTGLIVALGLLIDNAIVIVEDVRSRIVNGRSATDAITSAVAHLRMPLFGSTLTTAFAFLPVATLPGPPGEFVGTIATSVILAITSSFLLAMTVIPALISLLKISPGDRRLVSYGVSNAALQRIYTATLTRVFTSPVRGLIIGIVFPVIGFWVARKLPEQFFPPSDRAQIQIEIERPAGTPIRTMLTEASRVRNAVADHAETTQQSWFTGRSAPTFYYNVVPRRRGVPNYAQAFVDVRPDTNIVAFTRELQTELAEQFPSSRILVRQLEQGPPFDAPVEIRLTGPELTQLRKLGSQLRLILSQTPHVEHTRSDMDETLPRIDLQLDDQAVRNAGLTPSEISVQLYAMQQGLEATRVRLGDEEISIRVKADLDDTLQFEQLQSIPLISLAPQVPFGPPGNQPEPPSPTLNQLAVPTMQSDVGSIVRIDGNRVNEVKAYLQVGTLPSAVVDDFRKRLNDSEFSLPDGYQLTFGGETEQRTHAVEKLIANGVVLFALMLLTLVVSFRSFRCALIIAIIGGLSAGLGPLALFAFGFPFGFMAIIGTMGLIGVAINDSIVVLAAIRDDKAARDGDPTRLAQVVSHCTRHVLATTVTTIAGFLPLILSGGGFWPPLAVTIAGGVGGATLLALYVVPSLHKLFFRSQTPEPLLADSPDLKTG